MEQHKEQTSMKDKTYNPAIVVHCKAGKGRTGMMISALMLFISMYSCTEDAVKHYNKARVIDDKGLTIAS
jgi:phosphatidylinositol-3,4,5-trisphosphate 3-phosphatase/dual-specificity protein phosphatase PTEN